MPVTHFDIRWPDGRRECCYSPSRAIAQQLSAGERYSVPEFLARARRGLLAAAERVRERYGYYCTAATGELARLEDTAAGLDAHARAGHVEIVSLHGLPPCVSRDPIAPVAARTKGES